MKSLYSLLSLSEKEGNAKNWSRFLQEPMFVIKGSEYKGMIFIAGIQERLGLDKFSIILIVSILVLLIAGCSISIYYKTLPAESFIENLLAGLTVAFIGIIIAISIVNKYISTYETKMRDRQWSSVRKATYEAIIDDLYMLAVAIYIKLPISGLAYAYSDDPSKIKELNEDVWDKLPNELNSFSSSVRKLITEVVRHSVHEIDINEGSGKGLLLEETHVLKIIKNTYEDIKPILDGIKYTRIQRVIQSSTDQEIIDALIKFEKFIDAYYYNIQIFNSEGAKITSGPLVLSSLEKLIDEASQLCSELKNEI